MFTFSLLYKVTRMSGSQRLKYSTVKKCQADVKFQLASYSSDSVRKSH